MLLLAVVPAALLFSRPSDADARVVWCAGDPAIIVNGNVVDVTVHLPFDRLRDVDYVEVIFHVPADAEVTAVINDSLLFEARPRVAKDLPAQGRARLFERTPVNVELIVHHKGATVDVAATAIVTGTGTKLWVQGTSAEPLWVYTSGAVTLRLFRWLGF